MLPLWRGTSGGREVRQGQSMGGGGGGSLAIAGKANVCNNKKRSTTFFMAHLWVDDD